MLGRTFWGAISAAWRSPQRGPDEGDLGVLVCLDEEIDALSEPDSMPRRFISLIKEKKANLALILVGEKHLQDLRKILRQLPIQEDQDVVIPIVMGKSDDPLNVNRQTLLKILLNAHSTRCQPKQSQTHRPGNLPDFESCE
jgi:hypothetical protein